MAGRKETVSDYEILEIFEQGSDPFLTTREVAENLDFSLEGARKRLYSLADENMLYFKKVGNSPSFWLTNPGQTYLDEKISEN